MAFKTTDPATGGSTGLFDKVQIEYLRLSRFSKALKNTSDNSLDFILLITGAFPNANERDFMSDLDECARILKSGGLLFIQGCPRYLPKLGVHLDQKLKFKYWIALESSIRLTGDELPSVHSGLLMFTKGEKFSIQKTRFPHEICSHCGKTLR